MLALTLILRPQPEPALGVTLTLPQALTSVIQGVGGLSHAAWRSFRNERKTVEASHVIDGDLIVGWG